MLCTTEFFVRFLCACEINTFPLSLNSPEYVDVTCPFSRKMSPHSTSPTTPPHILNAFFSPSLGLCLHLSPPSLLSLFHPSNIFPPPYSPFSLPLQSPPSSILLVFSSLFPRRRMHIFILATHTQGLQLPRYANMCVHNQSTYRRVVRSFPRG